MDILDTDVPTGVALDAGHGNNPVAWFDDVMVSDRFPVVVALTSSLHPAPSGQAVTFTGVVQQGQNPTGRMNFSVDGSALAACTDVPVVNATATCTTAGISAGSHVILARYTGNSQNMAAEASMTQVIQPSVITFPLTVNNSNPGGGTISSAPAGIDCGLSCAFSFNQGAQVTLSAHPANGFLFSGWGGACGGANACVLTMYDAKNVTAQFDELPKFPLQVVRAATGIVTSAPGGIDCGAKHTACRGQFATVALTATPLPGHSFKKWVGCPGATGDTCNLTLTRAARVQAQFVKIPSYAIKVTKNTLGTVTSSPQGLNCTVPAKNCAARFITGTTVTLTAQPIAGAAFVGWTGACTGNGACVVTLNGTKKVTAKFQRTSTAAWLGDWVQVNFLGASDNGAWGEDNPSGLGFVSRIDGQTWIETDDYGDGCAITYTYTIQTNGKYAKKAVNLGDNCPPMSLPSLKETGKLQFAEENGRTFMYEYFTLAPGDDIIAFKWMRL